MTHTDSLLAIVRELEATDPRLAIRLRSVTHDVSQMERSYNCIVMDAAEDERGQAAREAAIHAAVIRDLAIDRAPNVERIERVRGMPFLRSAGA